MTVKLILQPPEQILETVCDPVLDFSKIDSLLKDLIDTLEHQVNPLGVGLSAPQIGVNARVFVVRVPGEDVQIIINPEYEDKSKEMTTPVANRKFLEGCLSLPELYGEVTRHQWIRLNYKTLVNGQLISRKRKIEGFEARVFQHEFDHLNGVLFTQRIDEQGSKLYKLEIRDGEEVLVEIN